MFKLESGVLDTSRIVSNILMIVLVAGNIYLSIQYIEQLQEQNAPVVDNTGRNIKIDRFLQEFITVVLNPTAPVTTAQRVQLENDMDQIGDSDISAAWQTFVNSEDPKSAQASAVKLMSLLSAKMLQ